MRTLPGGGRAYYRPSADGQSNEVFYTSGDGQTCRKGHGNPLGSMRCHQPGCTAVIGSRQ